jgi:hypothetical protein
MKTELAAAAVAAVLLSAVPSGAGLVQRPPMLGEEIKIELTGRVQSVGVGNSFTISARRTTFRVDSGDGLERLATKPRVGQRVRVIGEFNPPDRIEADRIEILPGSGGGEGSGSPMLSGSIRSINEGEERLSLATPTGNVQVYWDEETLFYRNRGASSIRSFKVGDSVRVAGRRRVNGTVLARRVILGGQPGWENNAAGEIVSLDRQDEEARVDFDGRVETVNLKNANIRRRNGQRIEFEDLRTGWDIRVQGTRPPRGESISATLAEVFRTREDEDNQPNGDWETVEGRVTEITDPGRVFKVQRTEPNEVVRVVVDENTNIVRGATKLTFSSIRPNVRVRVRGRMREGSQGNSRIDAGRVEVLNLTLTR